MSKTNGLYIDRLQFCIPKERLRSAVAAFELIDAKALGEVMERHDLADRSNGERPAVPDEEGPARVLCDLLARRGWEARFNASGDLVDLTWGGKHDSEICWEIDECLKVEEQLFGFLAPFVRAGSLIAWRRYAEFDEYDTCGIRVIEQTGAWLFDGATVLVDYDGWRYRLIPECLPRRSPPIAPAWKTATVVSLARAISAGSDFALLPILADALEEGGCEAPEILGHCRKDGEHGPRCWVIDWVLYGR